MFSWFSHNGLISKSCIGVGAEATSVFEMGVSWVDPFVIVRRARGVGDEALRAVLIISFVHFSVAVRHDPSDGSITDAKNRLRYVVVLVNNLIVLPFLCANKCGVMPLPLDPSLIPSLFAFL